MAAVQSSSRRSSQSTTHSGTEFTRDLNAIRRSSMRSQDGDRPFRMTGLTGLQMTSDPDKIAGVSTPGTPGSRRSSQGSDARRSMSTTHNDVDFTHRLNAIRRKSIVDSGVPGAEREAEWHGLEDPSSQPVFDEDETAENSRSGTPDVDELEAKLAKARRSGSNPAAITELAEQMQRKLGRQRQASETNSPALQPTTPKTVDPAVMAEFETAADS